MAYSNIKQADIYAYIGATFQAQIKTLDNQHKK